VLWAVAVLAAFAGSAGCRREPGGTDRHDGRRSIVDIKGNVVRIPLVPRRVACLDVLCFSASATLGQTGRIASTQVNSLRAPWTARIVPGAGSIPVLSSTPSAEEFLARRVDLVVGGYGGSRESEKFAQAGIAQVQAQPRDRKFRNATEFVEAQKEMMRIYGAVYGDSAVGRAEEWCRWYDSVVALVSSRSRSIPASSRPKIFFSRGPGSVATTLGSGGLFFWYGDLAGAAVVPAFDSIFGKSGDFTVSMEEIARWNPAYVFVDRQYATSIVTADARWKDVDAVRTKRVFAIPAGVFYWDGGPESALLLPLLAKALHPELFADLDLRAEVQRYYHRFYRTDLTDAEADLLLRGLGPDGRRENPWKI
jgi:iron complex transport system substrate-binding protein